MKTEIPLEESYGCWIITEDNAKEFEPKLATDEFTKVFSSSAAWKKTVDDGDLVLYPSNIYRRRIPVGQGYELAGLPYTWRSGDEGTFDGKIWGKVFNGFIGSISEAINAGKILAVRRKKVCSTCGDRKTIPNPLRRCEPDVPCPDCQTKEQLTNVCECGQVGAITFEEWWTDANGMGDSEGREESHKNTARGAWMASTFNQQPPGRWVLCSERLPVNEDLRYEVVWPDGVREHCIPCCDVGLMKPQQNSMWWEWTYQIPAPPPIEDEDEKAWKEFNTKCLWSANPKDKSVFMAGRRSKK